ncbi:MAG: S41 family peptidase [Limisphaera sp.]
MRYWSLILWGWVLAHGTGNANPHSDASPVGATGPAAPPWQEVYELALRHVPGLTQTELDHALLDGLLARLGYRAAVLPPEDPLPPAESPVKHAQVFEGNVGYIRVARVEASLPVELPKVWQTLSATNAVAGWILDLREANGLDYAAAQAAAALFLERPMALLDWGAGAATVSPASPPCSGFLVVLVNGQTRGAAEALAGALRLGRGAVIVGSRTAGAAALTQVFTLSNGQRLRLATTPVRLANGTSLSPIGLEPDIPVAVSREAELTWLADPFSAGPAPPSRPGERAETAARRSRANEAALVRAMRQNAAGPDTDTPDPETAGPNVVRDPALARALDLVKAMAILEASGLARRPPR